MKDRGGFTGRVDNLLLLESSDKSTGIIDWCLPVVACPPKWPGAGRQGGQRRARQTPRPWARPPRARARRSCLRPSPARLTRRSGSNRVSGEVCHVLNTIWQIQKPTEPMACFGSVFNCKLRSVLRCYTINLCTQAPHPGRHGQHGSAPPWKTRLAGERALVVLGDHDRREVCLGLPRVVPTPMTQAHTKGLCVSAYMRLSNCKPLLFVFLFV